MARLQKHGIILKLKLCAFQWYLGLHSRVTHHWAPLSWNCGAKMQLVHFWTHVILGFRECVNLRLSQWFSLRQNRESLVIKFYETRNLQAAQDAFGEAFQDREPPAKTTIRANVRKYEAHGTSLNRNKGRSGRPRTARSQKKTSLPYDSNWLTTHRRQVQDGMVLDWAQPLSIGSHVWTFISIRSTSVMNFCLLILQEDRLFVTGFLSGVREIPDFFATSLSGMRLCLQWMVWSTPPVFNFETMMSREKVTVRVRLCGNGVIIGPFFFERNVNGQSYLQMINECWEWTGHWSIVHAHFSCHHPQFYPGIRHLLNVTTSQCTSVRLFQENVHVPRDPGTSL